LSTRIKFHSKLFSESLNISSPEYRKVTSQLAMQIQHHSGSNLATAIKQGQYMLLSHINKQAYIEAVNDDFMIAAIITLIGIVPIIWIHSRKKRQIITNSSEYKK
jgi:DHA2 family multidrug resistance protein